MVISPPFFKLLLTWSQNWRYFLKAHSRSGQQFISECYYQEKRTFAFHQIETTCTIQINPPPFCLLNIILFRKTSQCGSKMGWDCTTWLLKRDVEKHFNQKYIQFLANRSQRLKSPFHRRKARIQMFKKLAKKKKSTSIAYKLIKWSFSNYL